MCGEDYTAVEALEEFNESRGGRIEIMYPVRNLLPLPPQADKSEHEPVPSAEFIAWVFNEGP